MTVFIFETVDCFLSVFIFFLLDGLIIDLRKLGISNLQLRQVGCLETFGLFLTGTIIYQETYI